MHFSIPETEVLQEKNGSSFVSFRIHVNGAHHCTLRYRQLRHLHTLLKQEFGSAALPPFPPRQLLKLSDKQLEERRQSLETYLQSVTKNPVIVCSPAFCSFFVSAQKETHDENAENVELPVYLMDGQKTTLNVQSIQQTGVILRTACRQLGIPDDVFDDLSLFILRKEENGTFSLVRQLQDFESPYLALRTVPGTIRLVIRKNSWDPAADSRFTRSSTALDLLYAQTVADFDNGWLHATEDEAIKLSLYQKRADRLKFLEFAKTLKHYGYIQFLPCQCDFPEPGSTAIVSAGSKELCFQICNGLGDIVQEWCFKVTRIRCWRITTLTTPPKGGSGPAADSRLELSFEYLMSKNSHRWITLQSDQAVLISLTLQGMVEELVKKLNDVHPIAATRTPPKNHSWSYITLDGAKQEISSSSSSLNGDSAEHSMPSRISFIREESRERISFGNSVYDNIGDDDL